MNPRDLTWNDIGVGDEASFDRTWEESDIAAFADLSGDENPLHLDGEYAKTTKFGKRLVYGMLLGSLCSRLVGMYLPGKRCLYLSQSLSFRHPVFIGDTVKVVGTVTAKSDSTGVLTIAVSMKKDEQIVVTGEARVQVM